VVARERRRARAGREEQVARLDQADVRTLAFDGERVADATQEVDPGEADVDVDRGRELLRIELADSAEDARA
jgi:hypothetical protein